MRILPWRRLRRVYCAGPLFNAAERQEMVEIADVLLNAGFDCFVPHRDGMEFAQVQPHLVGRGYDPIAVGQLLHEAVFALDVQQVLTGCGSVICNLNGRVPDEGAVAEAAMAWTLGKPVVFFKEDCRSMVAGRDNPLVVGMGNFKVVRELRDLPAALERRLTEEEFDPSAEIFCPPHLRDVLNRGEALWNALQSFGTARPNEDVARTILSIFDPQGARLQTAPPPRGLRPIGLGGAVN